MPSTHTPFSANEESVLKKYSKAVVHLRQQYRTRRLGLFFGAGISKPYNIPNWQTLIQRIAEDKRVKGKTLYKSRKNKNSQTSLSHLLYEHFKSKLKIEGRIPEDKINQFVKWRWFEIIHENLYKNTYDEILNIHPYLEEYVDIILNTKMTVNYNFDDCIERLISAYSINHSIEKPYESVWDARMQFKLTKGIHVSSVKE